MSCLQLPFLRDHVNYIWCGMWMGILYTACLATAIVFKSDDPLFARQMTLVRNPSVLLAALDLPQIITCSFTLQPLQNVLYGIFPAIALGYGLTWIYHAWMKRPLARFTDPANKDLQLKKVYKFTSDRERGGLACGGEGGGLKEEARPGPSELTPRLTIAACPDHAILLARIMRKFDLDGIIDPEAADLGEMVIKCGLTRFPNSPQLLILLGNFLMEVRRDGPASRTCLTVRW